MRALRNERGVAMTTVLLMGATLTVLTSAAVFVTVQEFRAGTDDRKAAEALAYAEAGVDRMVQHLRSGSNLTYATLIRRGCATPPLTLPQGSIGNGTFTVSLQVFNPSASNVVDRYPQPPSGGACATVQSSPRKGQHFLITSTGEHPASKRVVQQIIKVAAAGFAVGIVADSINTNGTPDLTGISILSEGPVTGRNQLDITGIDPYYTLGDFWPDKTWGGGLTAGTQVPAAAHAAGGLFLGSNPEFPVGRTVNCAANKTASNKQSLWDSDGSAGSGPLPATLPASCTGQISPYGGDAPSTSKFTQADYDRLVPDDELSPQQDAALKRAAQTYGIYCLNSEGTWSCTSAGVSVSGSPYTNYAAMIAAGLYSYTAYYEFAEGDATSNWFNYPNSDQTMWAGSTCTDPTTYRNITVRVKNGGFNLSGNTMINGAIIADGNFDYTGTPTINGTVMASNFRIRGTADFSLDECWVANMPLAFLSITPTQWSEADR
jgi:hypothetical protein